MYFKLSVNSSNIALTWLILVNCCEIQDKGESAE